MICQDLWQDHLDVSIETIKKILKMLNRFRQSCEYWMLPMFALFLACTSQKADLPKATQVLPNFVLIMADDLGYGGIGCFGNSQIKTPHLDSMAGAGIKFASYYANSTVCSPTRAALLSGRYQQRSGMEGVIYVKGASREVGFPREQITLAEMLKSSGYATGIIGKWHLGYREEFNPTYQGFDHFKGYLSGNIDFHTHYDNAGIYDWYNGKDTIQETGYVTDLITQHSIDFINKNQNRPFFLYVAHQAPHAPFQGRNDPGYRFPDQTFSYYGPVTDKKAAYIEMVEVMDEGIGEILTTLEKLQLAKNTLVVFVSDNGAEEKYGDNGLLRGHKTNLFEGGIRVPAIAYWPGTIKPAVSSEPVMSFDWYPTFLSLSKTDNPPDLEIDGIDLSDHLIYHENLIDRPLFWRYRKHKAVRSGKIKLLVSEGETYLFDLENDPREQINLANTMVEKVKELSGDLEEWENEMDLNQVMITN